MAEQGIALVTGASGFVGQALVARLQAAGWRVRAALRAPRQGHWDETAITGDLGADCDWTGAMRDVSAVFHLAGRVHVLNETAADPEAAFQRTNVDGTRVLLEAAQEAGVGRFVFVSSVKVLGESTPPGQPFTDASPAAPEDAYGRSKWQAENLVRASSVPHTIVRPPLVYGPGVGANFGRMAEWVRRGRWLPLGAVENRRSLVYARNLADALVHACGHPAAAGQTFLLDDGTPTSTSQLLRELAAACGHPARLIRVPPAILRASLTAVGLRTQGQRLMDSLEVDSTRFREQLDWTPPFPRSEGLAATMRAPPQSA